MTRIFVVFAITLAAISCGSSRSVDRQTFGTLEFSIPSDWQRGNQPLSDVYTQRVQYAPHSNDDKQSIVIMHTSPHEAQLKAGPAHVEMLLEAAQKNLARARFSKPTRFRNELGLAGVRIEGSFVPPGQTEAYQRLHAVMFDEKERSFIHVLYTARTLDREAFEIVVDSISKRGA
jgi:hypothetical protein